MKLQNLYNDSSLYNLNNEIHTLHECFIDLGMPEIAEQVISFREADKINDYVKIAQNKAISQKNLYVLTQLEFAGLIYSSSLKLGRA